MSDAIDTIPRGPDGRILPGRSLNPNGRPALPAEFRKRGPKMLERMREMAEDPDHEHHFEAVKWCCERIYGKAQAILETDGPDGPEVEPVVAVLLARSRRGAAWEQVLEGELAGDDLPDGG
jgi:hypothetical protein